VANARREFIVLQPLGLQFGHWYHPRKGADSIGFLEVRLLQCQATPKACDHSGFLDNGLVPGRDFILEPHFTNANDRFETLAKELALKGARVILSNNPRRYGLYSDSIHLCQSL